MPDRIYAGRMRDHVSCEPGSFRQGMTMITLLNIGRFLMVVWIGYALLLVFAPRLVHSEPNMIGGVIQAIAAFTIGYLLDRILGLVLQRKAARADPEQTSN